MADFCNDGTIMQLELSGCTIVNRGTIMNIDGSNNFINNYGTIMGGPGNARPQVKEKIVYRDRVVYRDRPSDVPKSEEVVRLKLQIQQLLAQINSSKKPNYVRKLESQVAYYEKHCTALQNELECMRAELENTARMKILKEIDELREALRRSENRERVSKQQQYEKGYQAGIVDGSNRKIEVFDWGVKPSREEAAALLKQIKIWLDCED